MNQRALGLLLAAVCVAACSKDRGRSETDAAARDAATETSLPRESAPWPLLPASEAAAKATIDKHTLRSPTPEPALTPALLNDALASAARKDELRAGWANIGELLTKRAGSGHSSYVLFGTFHDAPGQITAFRSLFGPLGSPRSDATLEQFHADGHWENIAASQLGDSSVLERFQRDGDRAAFDAVLATQRDHNYTAWKFDYREEMLSLVATLRASGIALHGCDMPSELQARARSISDEALARLRELHCVLALDDSLRTRPVPAKVAMLWGAEHVASDAVQRFLPADADVSAIVAFGGRSADDSIDAHLAESLRLTGPVLFPVEGKDRFALLLAEGALRASTDRVRTEVENADSERLGKLEVTSERDVELLVEGKSLRVGPKLASLPLSAGDHAFLALPRAGLRIAGLVPMPEHGFVELALEPRTGSVRLVVHGGR